MTARSPSMTHNHALVFAFALLLLLLSLLLLFIHMPFSFSFAIFLKGTECAMHWCRQSTDLAERRPPLVAAMQRIRP
ncbi:hypothetical protein V8C37DRAFT_230252 [Trichoderma ceciliae]